MKVAGIIAEYNPFHKGHKYQLDALKQQVQPDYIIIAMSGDFLQRGTPALLDKYARAHMALLQGADLVLELPAYFSTSSAEAFARGGILLFSTTGLTDILCFGAESAELSRLQELSRLLSQEPDWYQTALLSYLKKGLTFPAARARALPEFADLLEMPNNTLAVEYLKAIEALHAHMEPVLIQRKGSGYHDKSLSSPLVSASAIRAKLLAAPAHPGLPGTPFSQKLLEALPSASSHIMQEYEKNAAFLQENDFSLLLHQALLKESPESLLKYADMTEALANRLIQQRKNFISWNDFCEKCDTRDITHARVSRVLTHLLLDIEKKDLAPYMQKTDGTVAASGSLKPAGALPYLRILGFRKSAAPLLTQLKSCAKAPLITSVGTAGQVLSPQAMKMLHTDIYASDLYRCVLTFRTGQSYPNEYQRRLLTVS